MIQAATKVKWYRCPVGKPEMAALNQRSDWRGMLQTVGFLALLGGTGSLAWWSWDHQPWYVTVALVFLHGTCWNFLMNGIHELIHDTVFKTKRLNRCFLRVYSFLGIHNQVQFWPSHTEHHKYTLHQPDDLEVVLPHRITLRGFITTAFVRPLAPYQVGKYLVEKMRGRIDGDWDHRIFDGDPDLVRAQSRWAATLLFGHLAIIVVGCAFKLWQLPVLITFAPFYGGALSFLINAAQHAGLRDRVADYRLCCRTIELNPLLRFLCWNMNYHTEHHMYAAVPCYRLRALHRMVARDMPPTLNGIYAFWRHLIPILARQRVEPEYQYTAVLPSPGSGEVAAPAPSAVLAMAEQSGAAYPLRRAS